MKNYLLILFCTLLVANTYGQETIHSIAYNSPHPISNFEDRDSSNYFYFDTTQPNNIWQIGTPSKTIFNSAYNAPLALVTDTLNTYPNGNASSFEIVMHTDDLTYISFWHRLNTDSLEDGGVIEFSTNGGLTWTNIINSTQFILTNFYSNSSTISSNSNQPGFTGNSNWIKSTIQGYALNFVRFRFTFTSDNINTNKDGWMIDSFDFACIGTGINEVGINSPIQIFPNPTSNIISVNSDNTIQIKSVNIYDMVGKSILTTDQSVIDISKFQSGLYYIEVTTDKEKYLARIVRE